MCYFSWFAATLHKAVEVRALAECKAQWRAPGRGKRRFP